MPTDAPSRSRVWTCSCSVPPSSSASDPRKPSQRSSSSTTWAAGPPGPPGPAARRGRRSPGPEHLLAAGELGHEPGEQPGGAVGLGALHDGAAVRQVGQRQQRAVAAVEAVEVHVGGRVDQRERAGHGAQRLGAAAARAARRSRGGRRSRSRWPPRGGPAARAGPPRRTARGAACPAASGTHGPRAGRASRTSVVSAGSHGLCCGGEAERLVGLADRARRAR